jgi:hypothetical protein
LYPSVPAGEKKTSLYLKRRAASITLSPSVTVWLVYLLLLTCKQEELANNDKELKKEAEGCEVVGTLDFELLVWDLLVKLNIQESNET